MTRRLLVILLTVCLVGAACSRDDDPTTGGPDTGDDPSGPMSTGDAVLDGGAFGDLGTLCSDGDATPIEGVPGINGTEITVGTFSDPGFAGRPGLNQELFDIAEAFVSWCNDHGGIGGYTIDLNLHDSKLFEHQQRMVEACETDFMTVGGGAAFDDTGEEARLACSLPRFAGYTVSQQASSADLMIAAIPSFGGAVPIGEFFFLADAHPDAIDRIGIIKGNVPAASYASDRDRLGMELAGMTVVSEEIYNAAGESTWRPFAESLADQRIGGLMYTGEPTNLALLMAEFDNVGYEPEFVRAGPNAYDESFLVNGGDAVEGVYVRTILHPFEEAATNPATQQYLALMETYDPSGKIALLGAQGLSSWLLWASSARECVDAGDLTRDCVYAAGDRDTTWTGGGLHAPVDVPSGASSGCFVLLQVRDGAFARVQDVTTTDGIFNCEERNVLPLPDELENGQRCPSGKVDPLPSECAA